MPPIWSVAVHSSDCPVHSPHSSYTLSEGTPKIQSFLWVLTFRDFSFYLESNPNLPWLIRVYMRWHVDNSTYFTLLPHCRSFSHSPFQKCWGWVPHLRFLSHSAPATTATSFLLPRNLSQSGSILWVFFIVYFLYDSDLLSHALMYCQQVEHGPCASHYSGSFLSVLSDSVGHLVLSSLSSYLWPRDLRLSFLHPWITSTITLWGSHISSF